MACRGFDARTIADYSICSQLHSRNGLLIIVLKASGPLDLAHPPPQLSRHPRETNHDEQLNHVLQGKFTVLPKVILNQLQATEGIMYN